MDVGKDVTKVWQRLDEYVTTDSQTECDKIAMDACEIANRLRSDWQKQCTASNGMTNGPRSCPF